jgi:hypothetical protein
VAAEAAKFAARAIERAAEKAEMEASATPLYAEPYRITIPKSFSLESSSDLGMVMRYG